jgi:hypothetical protein
MKRLTLLIFLPALIGCVPDKTQTIAQCRLDAQKTYSRENPERSDKVEVFVMLCMRAAGFEMHLSDECKLDGGRYISTDLQPGCYRSVAWYARAWRYVVGDRR